MRFPFAIVLTAALTASCASSRQSNVKGPSDPLAEVEGKALFADGQRYAQMGDLVRAEQYLVAAIEKGHPSGEVLPVLIQVCVAGDRFDTALHHAMPHLLREPQDWALRYMVATLYNAVGRSPLAIEHLERVLLDAPEEANPHYTLGKLLWKEKETTRAVTLIERYIQLAPAGNHASDARALLVQWKRQGPVRAVRSETSETPASEPNSDTKTEGSP